MFAPILRQLAQCLYALFKHAMLSATFAPYCTSRHIGCMHVRYAEFDFAPAGTVVICAVHALYTAPAGTLVICVAHATRSYTRCTCTPTTTAGTVRCTVRCTSTATTPAGTVVIYAVQALPTPAGTLVICAVHAMWSYMRCTCTPTAPAGTVVLCGVHAPMLRQLAQ